MQANPLDDANTYGYTTTPAHASRVPRAWRLLTAASAVLLLLGYMILPVVFGDDPDVLRVDQTASTVFAFLFIGAGCVSSVIIAYFQRNKKIFLLRSLFMPYLAINLLSLFNVVFNVLSRNLLPLDTIRVVGIGVPTAFSVIYGLSAFLIYREYGPTEGHRAEDGTPLLQINQEDLTRHQLRRLLEDRNSGAPSPDIVHSTYRLDLPGMEPPRKTWDPQTSPPASRTWSSTGRTMV